ncbi:hypothetical protein Aperf_G00000063902 [Anoplocephala perfoliata]
MAVPILHPNANQRQYIKRVPTYITTESFNKSTSPNGSWRNLSVNSKSASISSGYGTPKPLQVDPYLPAHQHGDLMWGREEVMIPGKKRHYNAIKQRSGEIWNQRPRDSSVPLYHHPSDCYPPTYLPRLDCRRKANADHIWSFERQQRYQNYARERYARQNSKYRYDYQHHDYGYFPDYGHRHHSYMESRNFMGLSSSSNESLLREYDDDYSPVQAVYGLSHFQKWKSEDNLFVSTLDEEATQIYNEILDVAGSLAAREQRSRAAEKHLADAAFNQQRPLQKYQSLYDLRDIDPRMEPYVKMPSRQIPKPLDSRRSRRTDQERTPTNRQLSTTSAEKPDIEAESALAALEDVISLDFLKPSYKQPVQPKHSGSIPIIRAYLGETEEDWQKREAIKMNNNVSPTTVSVIEVDESSDDEEKGQAARLDNVETALLTPIQALNIEASDQGSGSYTELTPPEDLTYISDIDD